MDIKTLAYGMGISALCLVIALIPVSAQPSADDFGLEDASGEQGTHVIVPVNITTVKNGPVQAIVFNIAYDKRVINVTNVLRGELTSDWNVFGFNNDFEGGVRVSLAGPFAYAISNGSSGSIALLNFSVERTSDSINYSHMTLSDVELSDPEGNFGTAAARNGLLYVVATPPPYNRSGAGGETDADGDGYRDIDETFVGTDPNDQHSYPGSDAPAVTPALTKQTITATPAPTATITPAPVSPKQTYKLLIILIVALVVIGIVCFYYYAKRK
ncbi:hypothetical protein C5S31_08545 [ANME-1 cluster archaeon GoMg2]|nr:hypothetical protein [ANME-1 cluster archaeon GoMg2]